MTNYQIKIVSMEAKNDLITKIHYYASVNDDKNKVETEGNWSLINNITSVPFSELKEKDIIQMLNSDMTVDGVNAVKSNLENQLLALQSDNKTPFPWLADTFTPGS